MNGPEHYREAEKDIDKAYVVDNPEFYLARAQVHATLALTAARIDVAQPPFELYTSWNEVLS